RKNARKPIKARNCHSSWIDASSRYPPTVATGADEDHATRLQSIDQPSDDQTRQAGDQERQANDPADSPMLNATDMRDGAPIRIGLVGAGRILPAHLRGYQLLRWAGVDEFRITAITSRPRRDAESYLQRGV